MAHVCELTARGKNSMYPIVMTAGRNSGLKRNTSTITTVPVSCQSSVLAASPKPFVGLPDAVEVLSSVLYIAFHMLALLI